MRTRYPILAIVAAAALLAAGCQLLVTFEDVPEGAGGSGGDATGGTGSDPTSSAQGGSISTGGQGGTISTGGQGGGTTLTSTECNSTDDCADQGSCVTRTCVSGTCVYTMAADGTLCGAQPEEPCKEQVCTSGECVLQSKPDGARFRDGYPDDCATAQCVDGNAYYVGGANGLCGADPDPIDCDVPFCNVSTLPGACITSYAPANTPCKKAGGGNGACDASGNCK